jgi:CRP/FNR family cyclic AMP-dependent transcriptional regulator
MITDDINLKLIPCLSSLGPEYLKKLEQKANIRKIRKKGMIFREADSVRSFFIVRSGIVKLFKTSEEGRELLIEVMEKGDHFCFAPMFLGNAFTVNAQAIEESEIIMMEADVFKSIIDHDTGALGKKMISALCRKVEHLSRIIEDLAFNDIEQRISGSILKMIVAGGRTDNIVTLKISHRDIASITGTVREVVSRVIKKFKENGIVVDSGVRHMKVDRTRLMSFMENEGLPIGQMNALLHSLPACSKARHKS